MFDYGFIGIQRDSRPVCSEKKGREKGIEERGRKGEEKENDEKERWEGGRRRGEGKEEIKTVYVL